MNQIHQILSNLPTNDVNLYIEMSNAAINNGDREEGVRWLAKGLSKARELQNEEKENEICTLLLLLL